MKEFRISFRHSQLSRQKQEQYTVNPC